MRLKGIERGFKAAVIRALARVMPVPRRGERPDWGALPHRVLYLRYDRIGDMILATGIIEAIVTAQPTVEVDVLASPANATVLTGNPHVQRVVTFDKRRPWTFPKTVAALRRARYDAVLDAMVLSPSLTTVLLMWASGARHRIGVAGRGNEFALTIGVPRTRHAVHYVDHSAALLSAFGVEPAPRDRREADEGRDGMAASIEPAGSGVLDAPAGGWGLWKPRLYLSDAERAAGERHWEALSVGRGRAPDAQWRLVANVSAGDQTRYWPEDRFIETLTWVRDAHPDLSVLVIGSPRDTDRIDRIASGAGVPSAHTPGVRDMMGLVAASDMVFTADTSVTHVASAFGTPAVVMFPRGRGALYGPYGTAGCIVSTPGPTLQSLAAAPVIATLGAAVSAATAEGRPELVRRARALSARSSRSRAAVRAPGSPDRRAPSGLGGSAAERGRGAATGAGARDDPAFRARPTSRPPDRPGPPGESAP